MQLTELGEIVTGALLITVIRFLLSGAQSKWINNEWSIFGLIGKYFCKKGKILKFRENAFYTCWHTTSFILVSTAIYNEPWLLKVVGGEIGEYFSSFDSPNEFIRFIYFLQMSFWFSCLVYCGFETWREDTGVLIFHHFFTLFLLVESWEYGYWKIGLMVLNIHDLSDIFLYLAKTFSYTFCPEPLVTAIFGIFALSFFVTRNIIYPILCIYPGCVFFFNLIENKTTDRLTSVTLCCTFMILLEILHLYWLCLIIRMVYRQIVNPPNKKRLHDERSDMGSSEGEMSDDSNALSAPEGENNDDDDDDEDCQTHTALITCQRRNSSRNIVSSSSNFNSTSIGGISGSSATSSTKDSGLGLVRSRLVEDLRASKAAHKILHTAAANSSSSARGDDVTPLSSVAATFGQNDNIVYLTNGRDKLDSETAAALRLNGAVDLVSGETIPSLGANSSDEEFEEDRNESKVIRRRK